MPWLFAHPTCGRWIRALCTDLIFPTRNYYRNILLPALFLGLCIICTSANCAIAQEQSPSVSDAQSAQTRSYGPFDKGVAFPSKTGILGQRDGTALSEIVEHLKVVGASSWTGMQGTGQITYGSEDSTAYSATLSILGTTGSRLDGQTSKGQLSIRINGRYGKIQEADGRLYPIVADTAASGIFQFELPRLADFPDSTASLLDRGSCSVDGRAFHRLTYEFPTTGIKATTHKRDTVATDLYFDPTTHLLVKSANSIHIDGARNTDFLRVITYDDYRKVGDSMIPFRFTQTLDGQKQWTLQLSEVQLNPALKTTFFEF